VVSVVVTADVVKDGVAAAAGEAAADGEAVEEDGEEEVTVGEIQVVGEAGAQGAAVAGVLVEETAAGDPAVVGDPEAADGVPAEVVEAGAKTLVEVKAGAVEEEAKAGAPAEVTNGRPINVLTYLATTQFIIMLKKLNTQT